MSETTAATPAPATGLNGLRPRISHVAYHVADIDRALAFYTGVLGMTEQLRLELGGGVHEVVLGFADGKGSGLILMWNTQRTERYQLGDAYSRFVLSVSDLDAAMAHLGKHAVPVVKPATDAGALRYSLIRDPDGYVVELLQFKRG